LKRIKPITKILAAAICGLMLWGGLAFAIDWKALSVNLVEKFKPRILSIEKLDQKSCWAVLNAETTKDEALKYAKEIGDYLKANLPPETNPKPMVRIFVGGRQTAVAIMEGDSYRAMFKAENMDPLMFKGQYKPQ